jgi:hypothetical protein
MNRTLIQLQTQLADVPALTQRVVRNEARIEQIQDEVNQMREDNTRGK